MIQTYLKNYFLFLSPVFILLTVAGMYHNYSPVPYMDMWDGYLDFYIRVMDGEYRAWIAQHNEHRLVFSNLLFFIDIHFFGGKSIFLLTANFVLMGSTAWLIGAILKDLFEDVDDHPSHRLVHITTLFSIIMIFSWIQEENITWGFQSQFFAAYFFPLLSFYLLVKSVHQPRGGLFTGALLSGIVSAGTMANGVMALPVLLLLSLLLKNDFRKSIVIFLTSLGVVYLYFSDYHHPVGHGSLTDTLLHHPQPFFRYLFAYLGGIFYSVFGKGSHLAAQIFGILLILLSLFFTYTALIRKKGNPYYFVILGFLLYYGATAFGTAGGRAVFGLEQAFTSRYMTPSLIAWSLLIALSFHYFRKDTKIVIPLLGFIVIISIALSVFQVRVFRDRSESLLERKMAIVALEMGIRDEGRIKTVFPFVDWIMTMGQKPMERNLSVFGEDDLKDIALVMGKEIPSLPENDLIGALDAIVPIPEDSGAMEVRGWVFDHDSRSVARTFLIVNHHRKIIGYALSGFPREDVREKIDTNAQTSGYRGYCFKGDITDNIYFVDTLSNKKLALTYRDTYESK